MWRVITHAQVLVVIVAFFLMVLSSYIFISDTERRNLRKNVEETISHTELNILADLKEPETMLGGISETIRDMILRGYSVESIHEYILHINDYLRSESNNHMIGVIGFYGVFNGKFLSGTRGWEPDEDYDPAIRPWYIAAVNNPGKIIITHPYVDVFSNEVSITFARQIFDDKGNSLGIVGLDLLLNRIKLYNLKTQFSEGSYWFLLSDDLEIIAHPNDSFIGKKYNEFRDDISAIEKEVSIKGSVSEVIVKDYLGIESILFVHKLQNGWYMGVVSSKDSYYQSTRKLAVTLSIMGLIFAALLIWIQLHISSEKVKTEERLKIMFDSTPLCANSWDNNLTHIDCNQEAVKLFDMPNKQEYIRRFSEFSPEYQPCGRLSKEMSDEYIRRAMEEGHCRFEWTHQKPDGELIPSEVTLVRVKHRNDFLIIEYIRDLRELKQMMNGLEQRTHLLDTVNSAASILLASNNIESFENSLLKSFELVGRCLDVDRVQIWRNETVDGELQFVHRYEWLSDYGGKCNGIPIGQQFSDYIKKEWEGEFENGDYINAPLNNLSKEAQLFWGRYDIKSIVIIPMFLEGKFWGFFSIDDCRKERSFSESEISILASAGLMMSSAVNRNLQAAIMREAEERTQIMIDAAPLCAFIWDKDLNIIECNQEAVNMFELQNKQEFFSQFIQLSPEYQQDGCLSTEKGMRLVNKAFEEGYSHFEWTHQKLNGEPIPADVICVRVKYKEEFTVIEYIRDLREQQAILREMRKAEIAEESSKAKSDFLAKMSHEIRTPMNAILGIAEIQLQDNSIPQVTKEALERIYNSGDMLLGIINDILDLSKIEAGKLELLNAKYDVASLIYDTVQLNIMRYENKPIEFTLDVTENVPSVLIGDELRLKQIFNNLLSNAFKYTSEGTVNLTISVETEDVESSQVILVFVISDTGQGMSADQVRKLGSEYARFNMEANRKTEGTGLGMNITMNLIQLMKGKISIESTPGKGSIFVVRLPQGCSDNAVIGQEMAENLKKLNFNSVSKIRNAQFSREYMPYGRVLIVDDVETNLYVAKGLMTPYGLSIDTAMSGFETIEKIRTGNVYDIIFMDHMMPRMDGIETIKIMHSLGYERPVVALTANAIAGQAEMFLSSGFDDFISKPIDIRQLNAVLNKLIRDKQSDDVIEAARKQKQSLIMTDKGYQAMDFQLAEFFVRDAKKAAAALEAIYINKCRRIDDLSTFIINTHAMKSALANIGETVLSDTAFELEQAGRKNNKKEIMSELPSFLESLYAVIEKLSQKNKFEGANEGEVTEEDRLFLNDMLIVIKKACASYNKKAAKETLAEIRQKTWHNQTNEWLSTIAELLLHSEFDEVSIAIDNYLQS
jgi:signal transduction histidine kinase/CheY-like chemotaxis protein/HPt (histidine-containing phosphotransfer) domain-containing protein